MIELIIKYPAIFLSVSFLTAVLLTIITANNTKTKYLSDMMVENISSRISMTIAMFMATFFTPFVIIQYNLNLSNNLDYYSFSTIIGSVFFIITPILICLDRYELHLITIKFYFLFAFIAMFLAAFHTGEYQNLFLTMTLLNLSLTCLTFWKANTRWLPEVIFTILLLIYLLGINYLTLMKS